jgi:hypothetical protein
VEPVIGWRKWRLDPMTGLLASPFKACLWPARGRFEAECLKFSDRLVQTGPTCEYAPSASCTCGIYGMRTRDAVKGFGGPNASTITGGKPRIIIVGRCSMWGRAVEHDGGYRTQFAYPYDLEVLIPAGDDRAGCEALARGVAARLRALYVVDVTVAAT